LKIARISEKWVLSEKGKLYATSRCQAKLAKRKPPMLNLLRFTLFLVVSWLNPAQGVML